MSRSLHALRTRAASFARRILQDNARLGWLGGPFLLIGVWASAIATLSPPIVRFRHVSPALRAEPLVWAVLLASVATLTRSVRARLLALPAAVWGLCIYEVRQYADGELVWKAIVATIFTGLLVVALAPVAVASLRARASRPGSIVHASHARWPWCAAFVVAGPIGDLPSGLWLPCNWIGGECATPFNPLAPTMGSRLSLLGLLRYHGGARVLGSRRIRSARHPPSQPRCGRLRRA
jgi:hypothetical protein